VKPVRTEELVARIHALARRVVGHSATQITAGGIAIDTATGETWVDGSPTSLTGKEFSLLQLLMYSGGRTLTRQAILDNLYNLEKDREPNAVEVLVGRLRRKIGRDRVATRRGVGYRLTA
jgi:DNA-binding response OmpR family regulator